MSENIIYLLSKTTVKLEKELNRKLKNLGVSSVKAEVLEILMEKPDGVIFSDVARKTGRERHDITTLIRRMTKEELVYTKPNPQDARSTYIVITEKGQIIGEKAREIINDFAINKFLKFPQRKYYNFIEILEKV